MNRPWRCQWHHSLFTLLILLSNLSYQRWANPYSKKSLVVHLYTGQKTSNVHDESPSEMSCCTLSNRINCLLDLASIKLKSDNPGCIERISGWNPCEQSGLQWCQFKTHWGESSCRRNSSKAQLKMAWPPSQAHATDQKLLPSFLQELFLLQYSFKIWICECWMTKFIRDPVGDWVWSGDCDWRGSRPKIGRGKCDSRWGGRWWWWWMSRSTGGYHGS